MTQRIIFLVALFAVSAAPSFAESSAISVLYFENTTGDKDYAWFSKGAADMLASDLAAQPELTVVEREQIEKVLKEQEKSLSDLYDEKSAVRIGKLTAARRIIIGAYIVLKKALRIDAKLVDVETGRVIKGFRAAGDVDKLFAVQKELTDGVLRELGVKADAGAARGGTESLEAAKAYYTGIDFLDSGAYDSAAQSFRQAIQFDPFYLKPQKSLEDAYKFLKDFKKQRAQRELAQLYRQAALFKARLDRPGWQTYAQFITDAYKKGLSQAEIKKLTDADPTIMLSETRGQCTWELEMKLTAIADKSEEDFGDTETAIRMHKESLAVAEGARTTLEGDPFYCDALYWQFFSLQYFKEWEKIMRLCEFFMEKYPDYRMMWAIENFYERAIEKLGGKKADEDD
ncbi:MAG: hypothetical protein JXD23_10705 [Spirochaetales bacterium]|nr:hypothetical protein [Spirochaetales bacterium]